MANESYALCTEVLREQRKPYPRTCAECGLGPCKRFQKTGAAKGEWSASAPLTYNAHHVTGFIEVSAPNDACFTALFPLRKDADEYLAWKNSTREGMVSVPLAALKGLEWLVEEVDRENDGCPICDGTRKKGHSPGCWIAAALAGVEGSADGNTDKPKS